ncbi:T9SS type A sorting domain-containing protein [Saccharicrinis sp. GN24d3]|uniref:T9SS type A sorting domain-containing protein n=1 Tax=Saccharicrinis sp. GN24d3 TaxID=3458416 RepID=UPI00403553E2
MKVKKYVVGICLSMVLMISCPCNVKAQLHGNNYWNTSIIPGYNGNYAYGTQAGAVDNNGIVYIGVQLPVNNQTVVKIVSWDGVKWSLLNGQLIHSVFRVATITAIDVDIQGNIYVLGTFDKIDNETGTPLIDTENIAKWEKSTQNWSNIGMGINVPTNPYAFKAIKVDNTQNIYIGAAGGLAGKNPNGTIVPANSIIKWDEAAQQWDNMAGGLMRGNARSNYINDIMIQGQDVYAIGQFGMATSPNGTPFNISILARWDGIGWSSTGTLPPTVSGGYGISVCDDNAGNIYISGDDPTFLLKYDGLNWNSIAAVNWGAGELETDNNNNLYLQSRSFTTNTYSVSKYDGNTWEQIGNIGGRPNVMYGNRNLANTRIYLGGYFSWITNSVTNRVEYAINNIYWDGTDWNSMTNNVPVDPIYSADFNTNNHLYFGGDFTDLSFYKNCNNLAGIVNGALVKLGNGVNNVVRSVDVGASTFVETPFSNTVFIGGDFTEATDADGTMHSDANHVVAWDIQTEKYLPLGRGVNGVVHELRYSRDLNHYGRNGSGYLFVGGEFTQAVNADGSIVNATNFVAFNLENWRWEYIGSTNGPVKAIHTNHGDPMNLFIGGNFTAVENSDGTIVTSDKLAVLSTLYGIPKWHGTDMSINGEVLALSSRSLLSSTNLLGEVTIGGTFTDITDSYDTYDQSPYLSNIFFSFKDSDNNGTIDDMDANVTTMTTHFQQLDGAVHHISGNDLFRSVISGEFTKVTMHDGSVRQLNHIAEIKGTFCGDFWGRSLNISPWGDGTNNPVYEHVGEYGCNYTPRNMLVVGDFSSAGNLPSAGIAEHKLNNLTTIASYATANTSPYIPSGTSAVSVIRWRCRNPHLKNAQATSQQLLQNNLEIDKFLIDEYDEFDLAFVNFPSRDTLVSFKGLVNHRDTLVYALVGVEDTTRYKPNPNGIDRSFDLISSNLTTYADADGSGIIFVNTVTDSPAIDIKTSNDATLINKLTYKEQKRLVGFTAEPLQLNFHESLTGNLLYTDVVDLTNSSNKLLVYYIKGFVDPANNQNGDPIGGEVFDPNYNIKMYNNKLNQTITFADIGDKSLGDGPFQISATSSSGLPVTFEVQQGNITLNGNTVTINGAGLATIVAKQNGDATYNPAQNEEMWFCVKPGKPGITQPQSNLLVANTVENLQWYLDNTLLVGEVNDTLNITMSGNYQCSTTVNGCTNTSDIFTVVSTDLAHMNADMFFCFANGEIRVKFADATLIKNITVYDLTGFKVMSQNSILSNKYLYNVSKLKQGIYIVLITTANGVYKRKIVIP